MALSADISNRRNARWYGPVITMTAIACRGRQIVLFIQGPGMDARFVFIVLVMGYSVARHPLGVSVAFGASFRHIERIDRRLRVARCPDAMHPVAAYAGRNFVVA